MHDEPRNSNALDVVRERGIQHVDLDAQVVAEEVDRVGAVGQDAADLRRRQHDVLAAWSREVREDGVAVLQVELGRGLARRGSSKPAASSRRTIAEPTSPRCPAT